MPKTAEIKTRFAPSPTGYLHIGGLRTCLFNYLFTKKNGGKCFLRIEDTDQTRFVPGAADNLIKNLEQLGIIFDEGPTVPAGKTPIEDKTLSYLGQKGDKGPYIQSHRVELYREYAQKLIESGNAYYCFATPEELDEMRKQQEAAGLAPIYDRRALKLTATEIEAKLKAGTPHVIRLKMPRDRVIEFKDIIRGKVSFMGNQIDDQILIKSDGLPTYHIAHVVDDHLMETTHVVRGEEWIASTPKHLVMFEAFGWTPPEYAHVPLILNKDRSKLSKRQNDVSVESYLEKGYLKEALINFIALLGWNPGKGSEKEIYSLDELIKEFTLENVNKAGAIFDLDKLNWFNQTWRKILYYRKLDQNALQLNSSVQINISKSDDHSYQFSESESAQKFAQTRIDLLKSETAKYLDQKYLQDREKLAKAMLVNEEKIVKSPAEINQLIAYFFEPENFDRQLLINEKMGVENVEKARESLKFCREILTKIDFSSLDLIKNTFLEEIKKTGKKNGEILWPLRAALTHQQFSVGAFESAWVLGKTETLKRLEETLV
jgi:glutamyl-tRNA synthetase